MDIRDFLILWDRSQPNGGSADVFLTRAAELAGVAQELREDYETLARALMRDVGRSPA
jgi:hypothetical protein